MPDVLAVVSKAVFERELRAHSLAVGRVWPTDAYVSQNKGLEPLAAGGRLFLVTVRPPDEALWLVGVLERPTSDGTRWAAKPNVVPIRDVSTIKSALRFESGLGLPSKPGVLGMSLQTPRVLAATDLPLFLGADAPAPKPAAPKPVAAPAPAPAPAGDFARAAEAWRSTRSSRFGAIADVLAAREPELPSLPASGKKVDVAKWNETEAAGDWRDLPRLLAALAAVHSPVAAGRVEVLARREDPRLVPALLSVIADPPYTAGTSRKFWQAVIAALEATGDDRARDGMRDLSTRYKTINDTHLGAWLAGAMHKAASRMPEPRALTTGEAEELAALEVAVLGQRGATRPAPTARGTESLADLFRAIVEAPNDDDPRLVYADVLSERGDERGELIVLQVERAAGRATAERADLERALAPKLLGWARPIATAAQSVKFERGFPAVVALADSGLAQVVDAVEWGTVHTLRQVQYAPVKPTLALLDGDHARNLDAVGELSAKLIEKLKKPSYRWTRVKLMHHDLDGDRHAIEARHLARFPGLTTIEIGGRGKLDRQLFSAAPGLTAIDIHNMDQLDASADLFGGCEKLEALTLGNGLDAERFAGLRVRRLVVSTDVAGARPWLSAIPSLELIEVNVHADPAWEELVRLFDRHPALRRAGFRRFLGSLSAHVERGADGRFVLTLPAGDRWGRFAEELVTLEPRLRAAGITSLVVYPRSPRHEAAPMKDEDVAALRAAWSDRLEVRELL